MKSLVLSIFCASIALGGELGFMHGTNYWGLIFQLPELKNEAKMAISQDFQNIFDRFSLADVMLEPPSTNSTHSQLLKETGHMIIDSSRYAIPWKTSGFEYVVTNGTNYLIVFDDVCVSYTNAIRFTNEHSFAVKQMPAFVEKYNNSYTNYHMSYSNKAEFVWNPKVINATLSTSDTQTLLDNAVPTNGNQIACYMPSILEYQLLIDQTYTNTPLVISRSAACYKPLGYDNFIGEWVSVFANGAWRMLYPTMP